MLGFFVRADVQQLDLAYSLNYEGAVVYSCLLKFMEWTQAESGSKQEDLSFHLHFKYKK